MKNLIFSGLIIFFSTLSFAQQKVVWKIIWPGGTVLQYEYSLLETCQNALRTEPDGSVCVAFQK